MKLEDIYKKCREGERLTKDEGLQLYREATMSELSDLATAARYRKNPDNVVTWVADTNLNYTNVCDAYCTFCAFYRAPNSKATDKYTHTVEEMITKIRDATLGEGLKLGGPLAWTDRDGFSFFQGPGSTSLLRAGARQALEKATSGVAPIEGAER